MGEIVGGATVVDGAVVSGTVVGGAVERCKSESEGMVATLTLLLSCFCG